MAKPVKTPGGIGNRLVRPSSALRRMGEDAVDVTQRQFGNEHHLRPNFVQLYHCHNVLIDGVTFINSPMWIVHPLLCENVTVRGVTINSHGPNNDGCDPESCRDVLIENCIFDTGDDCIAIKSGACRRSANRYPERKHCHSRLPDERRPRRRRSRQRNERRYSQCLCRRLHHG